MSKFSKFDFIHKIGNSAFINNLNSTENFIFSLSLMLTFEWEWTEHCNAN